MAHLLLSTTRSTPQKTKVKATVMEENILPAAVPAHGGINRTKNLSNEDRQNIIEILLQHSTNGKADRGFIKGTSERFNISRQTVSKLWRLATVQMAGGGPIDVKSKKKTKSGRKPCHVDLSGLSNIPLFRRTNLRSLVAVLKCSKSTLHRLLKKGLIKAHGSAIKPFLSPLNMKKRLDYCLSQVKTFSPNVFESNYQTIHIDEKWFYMTKPSNKYYMDPSEDDPYRTCKSKRFITKVMFMGAVARPRFSADGSTIFDGKIGIFPFVVEEPTKRRSKNRPAGVIETKAELSITKSVIRTCLIDKLLPAIKSKWPANAPKKIEVQQDNARPHLDPNDPEWLAAANEDGWEITLKCQPTNSPDLNVLDLGFFRAIQSLQHQNSPKTVIDLVGDVIRAFDELEMKSLNFVWLSLQQCMLEIMKAKGSNSYKLQHMNKNRLFREGLLPESLEVPQSLFQEVLDYIQTGNSTTDGVIESQFVDEDLDDLQP